MRGKGRGRKVEWLDKIPPGYSGVATFAFVIAMAVFAAWSNRRRVTPKVQEFSMSGQLADMGPVKELVGQTGLLVQQQLRTALVLERLAAAVEELVKAYTGQIKAELAEQEMEDEVERRVDKQLRERRSRQRRTAPPRKPG